MHWQKIETFPTGTNGGLVYDNRTHDAHDDPYATTSSFSDEGNVICDEFGSRRLRIGNLLLVVGQGLAVFDIGDPENVIFLDSLTGAYTQYTTQYQVWRSQVVYVNGDNNNEGGNNLVTIDFSDPTDLKFGFGMPYEESTGRYIGFQDEFGPDEGSRNTKSFIGKAGTAYGRVQCSANVDEMQDFEMASREFMGKGFISDEDYNAGTRRDPLGDPVAGLSPEQDALAAYAAAMDTFPDSPYKNEDGTLTADGVEGKAVFESLYCGSCHGGDIFTDSPRGYFHDVGTITKFSGKRLYMPLIGLDTPTLRDVWRTWPYLNGGSAETLLDVIDVKTNDTHGITSGLTNTEKNQLVSYLLQIDGTEPAPDTSLLNLEFTSISNKEVIPGDTIHTIPEAISTSINGITAVTYYAFQQEVAKVTSSPWETTYTPGVTGRYLVHVKVTYNNGRTHSVTDDTHVILAGICTIDYAISKLHSSGGQVDITITNNTDADIVGWSLKWTLGTNESISDGWSATCTVDGSVVTALNDVWNGIIPANGGTVVLGFLIVKEGYNISTPTDFTLNGHPCSSTSGSVTVPTATPTDSGATAAPTPEPTVMPTEPTVLLKDVNSDGNINIIDALLVAQEYVGFDPANFNPDAADVNCDGNVNIIDALLIARYYVGFLDEFC